jgi:hypothetical protein
MGVGRNLAYKEEFFNVNGFINHIQVRSGDDDIINEAATATNTAIVYTPRALQSVNHIQSISGLHKRHIQLQNIIKRQATIRGFLLQSATIPSFTYNFINIPISMGLVLSLIAIRYLCAWIVIGFSASKLRKDLNYWFPMIELVLILTQINIFMANIFSKPVNWK